MLALGPVGANPTHSLDGQPLHPRHRRRIQSPLAGGNHLLHGVQAVVKQERLGAGQVHDGSAKVRARRRAQHCDARKGRMAVVSAEQSRRVLFPDSNNESEGGKGDSEGGKGSEGGGSGRSGGEEEEEEVSGEEEDEGEEWEREDEGEDGAE